MGISNPENKGYQPRIASVLQGAMKYHKVDLFQLAEKLKLSLEDAGRLVNGCVKVDQETAKKLQDVFGIHALFWQNLLPDDDDYVANVAVMAEDNGDSPSFEDEERA